MQTYVAFLRGINVGGNAIIKMSELVEILSHAGLNDVRTYIQSGNIVYSSDMSSDKSAKVIFKAIKMRFNLDVPVVIFSEQEWQQVIHNAPKWWGNDDSMKHNILIMTEVVKMADVLTAIGELKPDIERLADGNRVLYQSLSLTMFGRTTGGKIASNPIYKQMTIRNYNTATKLVKLLDN